MHMLKTCVAIQFGMVSTRTRLIEAGTIVNDGGEDGSPFHTAAYHGREDMLHVLYRAGANVNVVNNFGMNALQRSTFSTTVHINIIRLLLPWGCCVNPSRGCTQSALLLATLNADVAVAVAELLLASGADPNCQDKAGMTPLEIAIRHENYVLVTRFLQANAQIYLNDSKHSLFEMTLQISSSDKLCNMMMNSGSLVCQEGWLIDNVIPDGIAKNGTLLENVKEFAQVIPSLERLCTLRIRECLANTAKFEVHINALTIPNSLHAP